jgi:hypothetical protein
VSPSRKLVFRGDRFHSSIRKRSHTHALCSIRQTVANSKRRGSSDAIKLIRVFEIRKSARPKSSRALARNRAGIEERQARNSR